MNLFIGGDSTEVEPTNLLITSSSKMLYHWALGHYSTQQAIKLGSADNNNLSRYTARFEIAWIVYSCNYSEGDGEMLISVNELM